jgi:hypothetical protein
MKNLLKRLKPEIYQILSKSEEKYPATVKGLKLTLEQNFFVLDLSYGDCYLLLSHTTFKEINLPNLLELFNEEKL